MKVATVSFLSLWEAKPSRLDSVQQTDNSTPVYTYQPCMHVLHAPRDHILCII